MDDSNDPKRCPQCGSAILAGTPLLLCAVCALTGETGGEDETDDDADGLRVGSYTLLGEIARGGMGVVYRARQDGLNRIVAIKVLPGAAFASAEFRQRFQREAETVARLSHPGIVSVHEIGQAQGQPFISMDFIEGPSLAERLAESRMTPEFSAHLVREVARAVDHAHRYGVAHRDLKPSNILIGPDNHPVLTDFGLARFMDIESTHCSTLDLMGSPPYLPPERVASGASQNPVAEDVYGLGAVLYHCLTGRPPFVADSLNALLSAVGEGDPLPPRLLNPSVPQDLETICLKCLAKSPSARYASAADVADELDRFIRGESILARPLSPVDHLCRFVRRKPVMAILIAALLLSIISGTTISLLGWQRAAKNAEAYREMAEKRRIDLYSGNMAAASAAMDSGNRIQARQLLMQCRSGKGESDLRGCEWFLLDGLLARQELFSTQAHDHILTALAWNPSGEVLLSSAHDGSLKSWKPAGDHGLVLDQEILKKGSGRIQKIQWLPAGSAFLTAESDFIRCRRLGESTPLWEIPGKQFSLTSDGRALAVSTGAVFFFEPHGKASLWELQPDISRKPELRRTLPSPARAVAISPDGRWLAIGLPLHGHHDEERDLDLIDLTSPDAPPRHLETSGAILSLTFSPDSTRLVTTTQSADSRVHGFETASGRELTLSNPHSARVWSATFTADSNSLLTTSSDRSLCLSSMNGSSSQVLPLAHDNEIWAAAIHPSGQRVATGDKDGNLKIYPLPLPTAPVATFPRHPHFRYARPIFSPDSSLLYANETSPAWRTVSWKFREAEKAAATEFIFYPTCIDPDGNAAWRDVETRQMIVRRASQPSQPLAVPPESWPATPSTRNHGSSTDCRYIYQFSESGHAATAELTTGNVRVIQDFCREVPTASALSPGGRFLAASTWSELAIHDFTNGKTTRLPNDPHWAKTIVFSPDGTMMATGGIDGHIMLRRVPDFTLVWKLSGHLSEVSGLTISPDGRTLVSSEIGSGLRFWRLDTHREVMRIALPEVCESLVFSPDGQSLAVTTCPPASPPTAGQVMVIPCPRDGVE
jgi:serine/threonine protein kinase